MGANSLVSDVLSGFQARACTSLTGGNIVGTRAAAATGGSGGVCITLITELGISLRGVRMPCVICNERRESQTALISYDDSVAIFRLTRMCNEA